MKSNQHPQPLVAATGFDAHDACTSCRQSPGLAAQRAMMARVGGVGGMWARYPLAQAMAKTRVSATERFHGTTFRFLPILQTFVAKSSVRLIRPTKPPSLAPSNFQLGGGLWGAA